MDQLHDIDAAPMGDVPPPLAPGHTAGGPDPLTYAQERIGADHRASLTASGNQATNLRLQGGAPALFRGSAQMLPQHLAAASIFGPGDWGTPPIQESGAYLPGRPLPAAMTGEEGEMQ